MKICGKALPPRAALLLTLDLVLFSAVLPCALSFALLLSAVPGRSHQSFALFGQLMLAGMCAQIVFYYHELYNLQVMRETSEVFLRALGGVGTLFVLLAIAYAVAPVLSPGLLYTVVLAPVLFGAVCISRLLALPKRRESVLVIGSGEQSSELLEVIGSCPEWNMEVVEIAHCDALIRHRASANADRIIVCPDQAKNSDLLATLLEWKLRGVAIEDAHYFYERATGRVRVDQLTPDWFVFSAGFENGRRKRALKRAVDLASAAVLLAGTLPLCGLVSLAILLEGAGPVLFHQDRIGLNGKPFRIHKFRTMRPLERAEGARWVSEERNRITRLGEFLRKYRLDELPQLWNVIEGKMSLVGPRPEQPSICAMLAEHIPYYHQRHTVPPGLTGWAQVRYHYGASIEESKRKLEFDLFYVKHLSLWLDLAVLIETIKVVLVGRGAR